MDKYVVPSPVTINIETTLRCNLLCKMCGRVNVNPRQYAHADMDMETFNRITPLMENAKTIWLSGFGEPLLHKELAAMVQLAKKSSKSAEVSFTTNAMLLSAQKAEELIDAGLDKMQVSIDGTTKWGHVGGGADMSKVIANLKRLKELKAEKGVAYPEVIMGFVAMKDNLHELLDVLDIAREVDVKFITVQPLRPGSEEMRNQNIYRHPKYARKMIDKARKKAESLGITIEAQFMDFEMSDKRRDCGFPSEFLHVSLDGSVYMCCGGMPTFQNVKDTPVCDIWNSEIYLKLRQSLDTGDYPVKCLNCSIMYNTIENQERDIIKHLTLLEKIRKKGFLGSIKSAIALTRRRFGF